MVSERGGRKTRTLAIRLSEEDESALRKLTLATARSRGAVVRLLIRQAVGRLMPLRAKRRSRRR